MKILHLTLRKKWFNLIKAGEKVNEFREYKQYWIARLEDGKGNLKKFDIVRFRAGYSKSAPTIDVEFIDSFRCYAPGGWIGDCGECVPEKSIVIKLGRVLTAI